MDKAELRQIVVEYLRERHTVLWLNWDLMQKESFDEATEWCVQFISDLGLLKLTEPEPEEVMVPHHLDVAVEGILSTDEVLAKLQSLTYYASAHYKAYCQHYGYEVALTTADEFESFIKKTPEYISLVQKLAQ